MRRKVDPSSLRRVLRLSVAAPMVPALSVALALGFLPAPWVTHGRTALAVGALALGAVVCAVVQWLLWALTRSYEGALADARLQAASLRESEERARLTIDGVRDYAIVMLDLEGRVAGWNVGAERTTGFPADEVLGHSFAMFHPPETAGESTAQALTSAWTQGRHEAEGLRVRRDGTTFWASTTITPLRSPRGELRGYVDVTRDITDRRRAVEALAQHAAALETEVERRTAELREANAGLEAFGYSVSHDLRAPLRSMQGFADALLEDYGTSLDPTARDYARRIAEASRRMDTLILDLLAYSRISQAVVPVAPVDLDSVVTAVLDPMESEVRTTRAVVTVESPLGRVVAHNAVLVQVVGNLVGNALKFVPAGSTPVVRVRSERVGAAVRLWVEDQGIGIDPVHHGRIFRVFERLHGRGVFPGTGIGLAIVRKGVERMGGTLGLESALGQGTRFWLDLPAVCHPPDGRTPRD